MLSGGLCVHLTALGSMMFGCLFVKDVYVLVRALDQAPSAGLSSRPVHLGPPAQERQHGHAVPQWNLVG